MTRGWAIAAVTGAALLWSSSYAVTKELLAEVGPLTIGAFRFALAAVLLAVMVRLRPRERPDQRTRRLMYLSGLLGITVYFIFENIGVELSTASDAALIVASYPLMTMLVELVFQRTRMPLLRVAGVLTAAVGAALVVGDGAEVGGSDRWIGDVLLLLGGLAWAGYNIVAKAAGKDQEPLVLTYYQTLAGSAGFLVASLVEVRSWAVPGASASGMLVYLAVACSVSGFLLYNLGLRVVKSSVAVNILNVVPVFGVLGAVLLNGESVRPVQLAGGAVIIAGVVLGAVERGTAPAPVTDSRTAW